MIRMDLQRCNDVKPEEKAPSVCFVEQASEDGVKGELKKSHQMHAEYFSVE